MALIAERWGMIPELRTFAKGGRPIWGTCAGLIFLADKASGLAQSIHAWGHCNIGDALYQRRQQQSLARDAEMRSPGKTCDRLCKCRLSVQQLWQRRAFCADI